MGKRRFRKLWQRYELKASEKQANNTLKRAGEGPQRQDDYEQGIPQNHQLRADEGGVLCSIEVVSRGDGRCRTAR
jgi:hypothetical protein